MLAAPLLVTVIAGTANQVLPTAPSPPVLLPCPPLPAGVPGGTSDIAPTQRPKVVPPLVIPDAPPATLVAEGQTRVSVTAVVDLDGRPCDVRVASLSHPDLGLEAAGVHAASQWRFEPATRDGNPVRAAVTFHFRFDPRDERGVWGVVTEIGGAEMPPRPWTRKSFWPPP